tara:strand:- start:41479 stop:42579 length:1101 start_codon:yes stop_codon:yes gene_type:complete
LAGMPRYLLLAIFLLPALTFCEEGSVAEIDTARDCSALSQENFPLADRGAFYHWQVRGSLPGLSELKAYGVETLYVRFFDVVAAPEGPRPVGIRNSLDTDARVIPVIYITVAALKGLDQEGIDALAENIWSLVRRMGGPVSEIQLDCDWTPSTRIAYFSLLESLRKKAKHTEQGPVTISSTIRLHQLKYFRSTGVPPADRGTLMIYNMGELSNPTETNSIFRTDLAASYLQGDWTLQYPIPLDIALPDFHWGVAFVHGSFHALIHDVTEKTMVDLPVEHKGRNFIFSEPVTLDGHRLPEGTEMRTEKVDSCARLEVLRILSRLLDSDNRTLIIFDYDSTKSDSEKKDLIDLFRISGASCSHASCSD